MMVPKIVQKLHASIGSVPDALSTCGSFYFIRTRTGKLGYDDLDGSLDLGMLGEGPSLRMLEQSLVSVYVPMLTAMASHGNGDGSGSGSMLLDDGVHSSHRELLANMQKFLSQVGFAAAQAPAPHSTAWTSVPITAGAAQGRGGAHTPQIPPHMCPHLDLAGVACVATAQR